MAKAAGITIRPFHKTDLDFLVSRQLSLYVSEYGLTFEIWKSYLTGGVHNFVHNYDSKRDCMYILENYGVPSGCIAIKHVDGATAQLRFYFLEPELREQGAGRKLMDLVIDFCREKKYQHVVLWTFSTLAAARHLYASRGFQIIDTHVNNEWGNRSLKNTGY
ncbi:MAG TPA: GNAT family N-acetyltransferase [Methanoregula sp.]|nr:GNAT family N-acetyltransferase [Methanoregula sp.]